MEEQKRRNGRIGEEKNGRTEEEEWENRRREEEWEDRWEEGKEEEKDRWEREGIEEKGSGGDKRGRREQKSIV